MENEDSKRDSKDSGGKKDNRVSKDSRKTKDTHGTKRSSGGDKTGDKGNANAASSQKTPRITTLQSNEQNDDGNPGRDGNATPTVKHAVNEGVPLEEKVNVAPAADGPNDREQPGGRGFGDVQPSRVLDVFQFLPPEALKTVKLKPVKRRRRKPRPEQKDKPPPGPIASKVVFLKKPEERVEPEEPEKVPEEVPPMEPVEEPHDLPTEEEEEEEPEPKVIPLPPPKPPPEEPSYQEPPPLLSFVDDIDRLLKETEEDKDIENRLNNLMNAHRKDKLRKLKTAKKPGAPKFTFDEMVKTLNGLSIPLPTNPDFATLHGSHGRWDPDETVIEYFSPMLRSFIPVNMRGRYRGCWPTDTCMKGLNISKIPPKRDALEGFIERGRHVNIQEKYDEMAAVAVDVGHLDYLIEVQAFQAETLPIPIFYDMLHMGMQVANESLKVLVQEEGLPPNNPIFASQLQHAEQLHRKIQMYGALGLERLESKRKGLGEYLPHWLKSRDEIIRDIMASKDSQRYDDLRRKEGEAKERETTRRFGRRMEKDKGAGEPNTKKVANPDPVPEVTARAPASGVKLKGRGNKVQPAATAKKVQSG